MNTLSNGCQSLHARFKTLLDASLFKATWLLLLFYNKTTKDGIWIVIILTWPYFIKRMTKTELIGVNLLYSFSHILTIYMLTTWPLIHSTVLVFAYFICQIEKIEYLRYQANKWFTWYRTQIDESEVFFMYIYIFTYL